MPLISMFPCSAGGASIDYNSRPQIDFDGKWIKPFVEFYDGEPYWEAQFFSSGTLSVTGTYTADAWLIGGGCPTANYNDSGNGKTSTTSNLTLSGSIALTIGAGGGTTQLGELASAGPGEDGVRNDFCYRFSDVEKSNEVGADGMWALSSGSIRSYAYGGWLFWKRDATSSGSSVYSDGEGYGAGTQLPGSAGHQGAAVIRIKI